MNPIICVSDFSEHTVEAAKAAAVLAHCMQGDLVLVHSVDERGQFPDALRLRLMNEDRPRLDKEAERLRHLGLKFDAELLRGVPDDGIVKFAKTRGARLVVVGGSPIGALEHWALGCIAEDIAESSPVPTLAVRSAVPFEAWAHYERPLKILLGLDLTANSEAALQWLGGFCRLGRCDVLAGLIADPQRAGDGLETDQPPPAEPSHPHSPDVMERLLNDKVMRVLGIEQVHVCVAPKTSHVDADLATLASETGSDLLVVGTHQWRGLMRLYHHSVSRGVLRHAAVNVLCVPESGANSATGPWAGECPPLPPMPPESGPPPMPHREVPGNRSALLPGTRTAKSS